MSRRVFHAYLEEFDFRPGALVLGLVRPDLGAESIVKACAHVEDKSFGCADDERPEVAAPCLPSFMPGTRRATEFVCSGFVAIVHPFFETNDFKLGICEALQFEQITFTRRTAPKLVGRVWIT